MAGSDYWNKSALRRYIINRVFNGVLDRPERKEPVDNPLMPMLAALEGGDSLIIFPEGTRNSRMACCRSSGLYHLAKSYPQAELVPVWIANLNRVMPKGRVLPLPLLCTTSFGAPLQLEEGEDKAAFLARTRDALLALAPEHS